MLPKLLSSQSIQIYIFKNVYTPTPETIQLTFIPQVLAWNIQYEQVYSTDIYSPYCWQHISNINIYLCWHDISNINIYIQLTYTPQMVGSIYPIQIYIFINVHSKPCARRAHRNPPTYSHPPSAGMIYPISTYIFN